MTAVVDKAGPLAVKHGFYEVRVSNYRQAAALAMEEAKRMTHGTRREREEAEALAHVSAREFDFTTPALLRRYVKVFTDIVVAQSLGQIRQPRRGPKVGPYALNIASVEAASAYAGLDARWHFGKYGTLPERQALDTGAIYAHAYSYASKQMVNAYIINFAKALTAME